MADEDQRWPKQIEHDRQRRILPHIFFGCLIFSKPQSTGICLYSNPPNDNLPDSKQMGGVDFSLTHSKHETPGIDCLSLMANDFCPITVLRRWNPAQI